MIKELIKYPVFYLIAIVVVYSVYDYFEHIGRSGSTFEAHPWYWLLFSTTAILSLILVVLFVKMILERLVNQKNLIIEVMALGVWLALYLSILGPLINRLFWPFDNLYFSFKFGPFFILLLGYFVTRILINLVIRKNALYSN